MKRIFLVDPAGQCRVSSQLTWFYELYFPKSWQSRAIDVN